MLRFWMGVAWLFLASVQSAAGEDRPNILWITSEDNGPHLGCYGDELADTPNLDALARRGVIYLHCWSNAPVCAPARTTIISGLYPPSTGSEHMRSMARLPAEFHMYPYYLREAGYYCTNNSKEDYNLEKSGPVWHESSNRAHWKNRQADQPFFAIFNITTSHESQIRKRPHTPVHDPSKVRVPAYHPDTPEVRRDWAQYYDKLTEMDAEAGRYLRELDEAGLADDTIIFYYGDHGSGMPRSKRWPYDSGLHVPLVVHIPERYRSLATDDYTPGGKSARLVGFIDLAPTLLSLAGVEPPAHFQGHAFLGKHATRPQPYLYGFRGRMDERYDMVRSVRDERYVYIRNYMPHKIYGQYIQYMFQTPTTREWKDRFDQGRLDAAQSAFWRTKPAEELYDLENDRDEVRNLAGLPEYREEVERFRAAQRKLAVGIRDVGFLPEGEIHARSAGSTPYEMGHDDTKYPLSDIMSAAERASSLADADLSALVRAIDHEDSAVRYWAAMGLLMRGPAAVAAHRDTLFERLSDPSSSVAVVAAQALGQYGTSGDVTAALDVLVRCADVAENGLYVAMLAINALDEMDDRAQSAKDRIAALPRRSSSTDGRMSAYVGNLLEKTLADLK